MKNFRVSKVQISISIIVTCAFASTLGFTFLLWDDTTHLLENPLFYDINFSKWWQLVSAPFFNLYIPATYTAWTFVAMLSHLVTKTLTPGFFHAFNVLFHVVNGILLWNFLDKNYPQRLRGNMFVVLLFWLHPIQVESVAWISGFREIFSTMFILLCLRTKNRAESTVYFAASILAKPTAVVLPLFKMAIHRNLKYAWWLIGVAGIAYVTSQVQGKDTMNFIPPIWARPIIAVDALSFYIQKFLIPYPLNTDYGHTPKWLLESTRMYWSWLVVLALGFICFRHKKNPVIRDGAFTFIVGLAPVLGFIAFSFQETSTTADRYLYFPIIGLGMIFTEIAAIYFPKKIKVPFRELFYISAIGLASWCFAQSQNWKNDETLYSWILESHPDSYIALNGLGRMLTDQQKWQEAFELTQRALKEKPGNPVSLNNLGHIYFMSKQYQNAVNYYENVFKHHFPGGNNFPVYSSMYTNYGASLIYLNRQADAIKALDYAIELNPKNAQAWHNRGAIPLMHADAKTALPYLQKAVDLLPGHPIHTENLIKAQKLLRGEKVQ